MSRWSAAAERNRQQVTENARRALADTAYDRFRTPRALRRLVAAYAATTIAIPVAWTWGGGIAGVVAVLLATAVFLLLRVAVRSLADLPDHVLDERMRRDRDSVYVDAFRLVAGVVFVAANVALVPVAFSDGTTLTFDYHDVSAVYWTLLALLLGAPSIALAIRQANEGTA